MIGFLNAYLCSEEMPEYQVRYGKMFKDFFHQATPELIFKEYRIAFGEWPESANECTGWIISGSSKSAYDQDLWILQLMEFIRLCENSKSKMVGICFGHQVIAHALGGKTTKSTKGWGVGVNKFEVSKHKSWMTPPLKQAALIFSHQDQVELLPPSAENLASNEFCTNQMYSIGEHIFSMQGHPEFSTEFARQRLDSRVQLLGNDLYTSATKSLSTSTNSAEVALWIEKFFTYKS